MAKITYGYDRCQRSWCIIVLDEEGNELESCYLGSKSSCDYCIEQYKEQYATNEVIKYRAY